MKVAELIEQLQRLDPGANVRLEADFDGMTGSGDLARVDVDDDGTVVLGDEETGRVVDYGFGITTVPIDGEEVEFIEVGLIEPSVQFVPLGDVLVPKLPAVYVDVDAERFPPGNRHEFKVEQGDVTLRCTAVGQAVRPGVTRFELTDDAARLVG